MARMFGLTSSWVCLWLWLWLSTGCRGYYSLQVGDPCPTRDYRSSCQPAEQCTTLTQFIQSKRLSVNAILNCGYTIVGEKICCPLADSPPPTQATTTTTVAPEVTPSWLSIFKTGRDYVQPATRHVLVSRDKIVFPNSSSLAGALCQTPLYEGVCEATSLCQSIETLLKQRRLRDEDVQTCRDGTVEEIICCPDNLVPFPRGQVGTATRIGLTAEKTQPQAKNSSKEDEAAIDKAVQLLPHYRHLAALAYPNAAYDGYLHRCTALVLTPQLLLSAADCVGASHAVFGVADMRDVDEEEDYLVDITRVAKFRDDLVLMRLQESLPVDQQFAPYISLAPICTQFELTRLQVSGQLLATAWAKGNASDCPLYELPMQLLPTQACKDISNASVVKDLPSAHLCLAPVQLKALSPNNSTSCAPCPASVGSVLHLLRPSGIRCVLGIATPISAPCDSKALYYTSLLSGELLNFVEQHQRPS